jgi:Na+-transporting NADH:ubiquinone oxidoreductase subunit NqrB
MQRISIKRIMIVLTAVLALAAFTVLSTVRSRMLAQETSLKKAAGDYSGLKKMYSQVGNNAQPADVILDGGR